MCQIIYFRSLDSEVYEICKNLARVSVCEPRLEKSTMWVMQPQNAA